MKKMKNILLIFSCCLLMMSATAQITDSIYNTKIKPRLVTAANLGELVADINSNFPDFKDIGMAKSDYYDLHVGPLFAKKSQWRSIEDQITVKMNDDFSLLHRASEHFFYERLVPLLADINAVSALDTLKNASSKKAEWIFVRHLAQYYIDRLKRRTLKQAPKYAAYIIDVFIKSYPEKINYGQINGWCWDLFKSCDDPQALRAAVGWAKIASDRSPDNADSLDTYANLLYKVGDKKEAIELQEKATKLNKGKNSIIVDNLAKMKAGIQTWN